MIDRIPRLAPQTLHRPRLDAWLARHAGLPVRLLTAPAGFGKTTALVHYARAHAGTVAYLTVEAATTVATLTAALQAALRLGPGLTPDTFAERVGACAPVEIVFDDVHAASAEVAASIGTLVARIPEGVGVIVATRRRDTFDVGTLFARGFLAVCDQAELAFTLGEAAAVAAGAGVDARADEIATIHAQTDGWPTAIAGIAREAAAAGLGLLAADELWQARSAPLLAELFRLTADGAGDALRAAVDTLHAGGTLAAGDLAALHRAGAFVRCEGGVYAPMRCLEMLEPPAVKAPPAPADVLLAARMFGRFSVTIGDRAVEWLRRRDQQIVKYLLLSPSGRATRGELADVFWPDTSRHIAQQNLRTACSTIRRALANACGADRVEDYLTVGESLTLNLRKIVFDVDRFRRHVAEGHADLAAGATNDALAHFRSAERLYGPGFLVGDPSDPAYAAHERELGALYDGVLDAMVAILTRAGSPGSAREYDERLRRLRGLALRDVAAAHKHLRLGVV